MVRGATCSNVPAGQEAHEESADGGEDKLGQPDPDEHGVAAAGVEPVGTQRATEKAGMTKLHQETTFSWPYLIWVAMF